MSQNSPAVFSRYLSLAAMIRLLAGIGIVTAVLIAQGLLRADFRKLEQMESASTLVSLSGALGSLVHELQKERGLTAGFLGTRGQEFGDRLRRQRVETDSSRAAYLAVRGGLGEGTLPSDVGTALDAVDRKLARLEDIRADIDRVGGAGPAALRYFADLGAEGIAAIGSVATQTGDAGIANTLVLYGALAQGKDAAAAARAAGMAGFAQGSFNDSLRSEFATAIARQAANFDYFGRFATPGHVELLSLALNSGDARAVGQMRDAALSNDPERIVPVDAGDWAAATGRRIDGLKTVEDLVFRDARAMAAARASAAEADAIRTIAAVAVGTLLMLLVAYALIRNVKGGVRSIGGVLLALQEDDRGINIPDPGKTEFAEITNAISRFKDALPGADDVQAALIKGAAFDSSSSAGMVIDSELVIIHVNNAATGLLRKNRDAFREIWPNFDGETIVGACIDTFQTNSELRVPLTDPSRLPHRADVAVGDLKFQLDVDAIYDPDGAYIGSSLEWRDITVERTNAGIIDSIRHNQAVAEYDLEGKVLSANETFLQIMDCTLGDAIGRHHSSFVPEEEKRSPDYAQFWTKLRAGEFVSGNFPRVGRTGRNVSLRASYNAIMDNQGNPFKIVEIANDATEMERGRERTARNLGVDQPNAGDDRVRARWHDPAGQRKLPGCGRLFRGRDRRQSPPHVRR